MSTPATFEKFDPKTGLVLASYKNFSQAEVFAAVDAAHLASVRWIEFGFVARKRVLLNWAAYINKNQKEIAQLVADECGKPIGDASLEVLIAIDHIAWAAKHAEEIMQKQNRPSGLLMFNMKAQVQRSPLGVVGVIGPWNYPIFTPMGSIAYALAAANAVVFKPSEFTPGVGKWLADSFAQVAPFENILTTVTGLPDTGKALTESKVNKISFTGSTRTAKKVAASCAEQMIPVVLECGGKDPVIVDSDADLKLAAEYALWSAMANAGQSCIGAERVYVVESVADQFVEIITKMAKNIEVGKDYGPATMPSQLKVIQSHLDDAKQRGAKFLVGGNDSVKGAFVEPVIMLDVPEDSTAMTQETFGPTLAINKVMNTDEAIKLSNASSYGLAAAVFSKRNGEKIAAKLVCGMVSINSVFLFAAVPTVPFGGVKDSGYGRIHGAEGLLEYTYARTVVKTRFKIPLKFTSFNRSKFSEKILSTLIKRLYGKGKKR
ncbi:MAG: aldehyde dehydrogenase family protein [Actinobacteria bacterium]|nr:aldehyde dehydrogenase family protein [Actinomycetota bacterium]